MKLRSAPQAPLERCGRTMCSGTRVVKLQTVHAPLERWSEGDKGRLQGIPA
jgi:hypothetical protein